MTLSPEQRTLVLTHGRITLGDRLSQASNETMLAQAELDGVVLDCVIKPIVGERPLWDFPDGTLAEREVAAAIIDRTLEFGLVPTTVLRADGPRGPGTVQCFIHRASAVQDPVRLVSRGLVPEGAVKIATGRLSTGEEVDLVHDLDPSLRQMALLDVMINNADRKGGHVLVGSPGGGADEESSVWGIDHGTCFNAEDKLRTVLWGWAGGTLSEAERATVARGAELADQLAELLTRAEVQAFLTRIEMLLERGTMPEPTPEWPRLPWPPL